MSLITILTLGRMFVCPIFLWIYFYYGDDVVSSVVIPSILFVLIILCELSDILDGFFARKMGMVTLLGKILDPMSDTIVRLSVFLAFTQGVVQLPLVFVLACIVREFIVGSLRTLCAFQGLILAARKSGKYKAVFQAMAIIAIIFLMILCALGKIPVHFLQVGSHWIFVFTALYTVFSGLEYLWVYRKYIFQLMR